MRAGDLRDHDVGTYVSVRVTLAPMVDATAAARHLVGRACRQWGIRQNADIAELIVTEFVSNVVRHARTEMEVVVALHRRQLHVSVRDHCPALPHPGAGGDSLREDGRGLLVVGALTDGWGCTPVPGGKVVWAILRIAG